MLYSDLLYRFLPLPCLCPGAVKLDEGAPISYDLPMDWTLSGEAKRYIENSVIVTTPHATRSAMSKRSTRWVGRLKR